MAGQFRNTRDLAMGLFRKERAAVMDATETAKSGINTALIIATAALVVAGIALVIGVLK